MNPTDGDKPQRRRRSLRARLALAAGALIVSLLLAEVGLRVVAHATLRERGVTLDEHLGYHMLPNVEKSGGEWGSGEPARTNSHGWRDGEHSYRLPADTQRILALGDSFTFGQNVDYGLRFTELLEGPGVEVVNLGACAYGPDQELIVYREEGRRYGAQTVLWTIFLGNDLDDLLNDRASGWPKPNFRLEGGQLVLRPPHHDLLTRWRARSYLLEVVLQVLQRGRPAKRKAADAGQVDALALFRAIAAELAREVETDGARLMVALAHPSGRRPSPQGQDVRAVLEDLGLEVLDLDDPLRGSGHRQDELFLPCGHWSPLAHGLVAEALGEWLE